MSCSGLSPQLHCTSYRLRDSLTRCLHNRKEISGSSPLRETAIDAARGSLRAVTMIAVVPILPLLAAFFDLPLTGQLRLSTEGSLLRPPHIAGSCEYTLCAFYLCHVICWMLLMLLLNCSPTIPQAASEQEHNREQSIQIEDRKNLTIEMLQCSMLPRSPNVCAFQNGFGCFDCVYISAPVVVRICDAILAFNVI